MDIITYALLKKKIEENTGKSAYDIAVENGFEGTEQEWLDSLTPTPMTSAEILDICKLEETTNG